jgi:hypothetical protein
MGSPFWASLVDFRFSLIGSEPLHFYYNCLLRLRDSGRLVSLAFEDSVRLAEEVEFMLRSTALPETRCSPPTLLRGWFGDAMAILGQAYRRPCPLISGVRYFVDISVYAAPVSYRTTQTGVYDGHL